MFRPHPARFARVLTAATSVTAFATMVGAFAANNQAAQATPVDSPSQAPAPSASPSDIPTASVASPTPVAKAKAAKKKTAAAATPVKKTTAKRTSGSSSVTYTCVSPKGTHKPYNGGCPGGYTKVKA